MAYKKDNFFMGTRADAPRPWPCWLDMLAWPWLGLAFPGLALPWVGLTWLGPGLDVRFLAWPCHWLALPGLALPWVGLGKAWQSLSWSVLGLSWPVLKVVLACLGLSLGPS